MKGSALRGRVPRQGGAYPAGAKTISFSAEKETVLGSSSERIPFRSIPLAGDIRSIPFILPLPTKAALLRGPPGRSTGRFYWENGGLRLYTLW